MKRIESTFIVGFGVFLLIALFSCETNRPNESALIYELNLEPDTMHVRMTYVPVFSDSTVLHYGNPFFGGMKDQVNSLVNLESSVDFKVDTANSEVVVFYEDEKKVHLSYDIVDTHLPEHRVVGEMFRAIITDDYFFSLSNTLFLYPDVADSLQEQLKMSVTSAKSPPFPMYYSFAPDLIPEQTVEISWKKGLNSLVMGASDMQIEKRVFGDIVNYIVLCVDDEHIYNRQRFLTYFDAFMAAMNNFWGEIEGDHYSLIAAPFVDIDYHKVSGTAFQDGFHVKYSGDTVLLDEEVVMTVSHEIMHRFIGAGDVSLGEENQWFDEGFTEYNTWYLSSKCGLISEERYQNKIQETYQQLSENPHKDLPNSEVMKHFWEGKDYERLPYQRGALYAAYLHHQMEVLKQDSLVFQQFMRGLNVAAKRAHQLTLESFKKETEKYLPKEQVEQSVQDFIINGKMIPQEELFSEAVSNHKFEF